MPQEDVSVPRAEIDVGRRLEDVIADEELTENTRITTQIATAVEAAVGGDVAGVVRAADESQRVGERKHQMTWICLMAWESR